MENGRLKKVTEETDLFESVFLSAPMGICICSPDGEFLAANTPFQDFIGYSEAELIKMRVEDITHSEDIQIGQEARIAFLRGEQNGCKFEKRYTRKNGEVVWGRTGLSAIRNEEGKLTRIVAMINDISALKSSLDEKAKFLSLLESTIDATAEGLLVVDATGKVTAHNQCFAEIWQIPANVLASNDDDLLLSYAKNQLVEPDHFLNRVQTVYKDRDRVTSDVLEFKDGRTIARSSRPQKNHGVTTGLVWSFRDITAQTRAERATAEALAKENHARKEAEHERRRAELLSEASQILTSSLDFKTTLAAISKLIVPRLGDWCGVAVAELQGGMNVLQITADPPQRELCERLQNSIPDPSGEEGIPKAIRLKKPLLYSEVNPDLTFGEDRKLVVSLRDPESIEDLKKLGMCSYIVLPMIILGNFIGVLAIGSSRSRRRFDDADLDFADEISRRCAIAVDNARLYQDALKTIQAREDFLSVASHELRTPLSPLRMQFEMALRFAKLIPEGAPNRRDLIEMMEGAGEQMDRLLALVDTLLDVTRITAGRMSLRLVKVDLAALFREVTTRFAPMVKKAGGSIELSVPDSIIGTFDRTRMEQVLSNLISNAIKFGEGKTISVALSADKGEVKFSVKDQGIGIEPQDRERIFERFERAAPSTSYRGLGLGLFIARKIIEAHAGKITVESKLGEGATFFARLPLRA
jgi:PAS domain S-box-containing protein